MPYKRRYRKKRGGKPSRYRRRYRRTTRLYKPRKFINVGVAPSTYCKLKYVSDWDLNLTGAFNYYDFRGNSLYDPDKTGVGHQPHLFDQMSELYNNYFVMGSKIKVTGINRSGSSPCQFMICAVQGSVNLTNEEEFLEQRYVRTSPIMGVGAIATGYKGISMYMSSKRIFGKPLYDDNYSASKTTNPTNQWDWLVAVANKATGTDTVADLTITIYYYCKFWNPAVVAPS